MDEILMGLGQFVVDQGAAITLSGAAFILSTFISYVRDKKLKAEAAELQKDIDRNKELLSRQGSFIDSILTQQQKGYEYTLARQAEAAEKTWKEVLRLRELCAPCVTIDSVLLPGERHGDPVSKIGGLGPGEGTRRVMDYCNNDNLEELRPYLGERLWVQFFALRAFSCRCLVFYDDCVSHSRDIIWSEDDGIRQMLNWVIDDDKKIDDIYFASEKMRFLRTAQETLEGLVFISISRILTGEVASEESMKVLSSIQSMSNDVLFAIKDGRN